MTEGRVRELASLTSLDLLKADEEMMPFRAEKDVLEKLIRAMVVAEQEKLTKVLEDNEHFKNAVEKFCEEKQGQQNMTDKLEGFASGWLAARAVLAEVIGGKKELPKFKDIIGLFVDKPEEEKK